MTTTRYDEDVPGSYGDHKPTRPLPAQRDRNGRMYEDRHPRPSSKGQQRRSSSSPNRYASPHDRHRTSHGGYHTGRNKSPDSRDWDTRARDDGTRDHDYHRRGRSPSPRAHIGRGYQDRDRDDYRSPGYDSRSRSQSPRRDRLPYYGGPPSREVILEGLPLDMVEEDISKELKQYHDIEKLDDIRVIRDRQTKVSRGFGFLRFPDIEQSKGFVERNFPMIYLYGSGSADGDNEAAKVRIAFSRERDDRGRGEKADGEWTCKICTFVNFPGRTRCFRCQTPQIDMATFGAPPVKPANYMNSGDSDVSPNGAPSQFLLLRGLEPTVTEDLLAKGITKLYKPSRGSSPQNTAASKKGNAKVASTTGDANLGAKKGSLRRVLLVRDRRSNESWRYGFAEFGTVDDAQAALTRFNSFEKFTISSKPVTADYIHAGVFVPVFNVQGGNENFTFSPLGNTASKLAYWDEEAWASELVVSSSVTSAKKLNASEKQSMSATDRAAAAAENEGLLAPGKEVEAKAKKRKAEASAAAKQKKTAPAHLQFWSNRHAELHGVKPDASAENDSDPNANANTNRNARPTNAAEDNPPTQTFADPVKKCCYLCSRQFKTEAELNKHERLSQLHRDNILNEDLVSKAQAKMTKAGLSSTPSQDTTTEEYRDRAKERRAAFGASRKTTLPLKKNPTTTPAEPDDADDQPLPPSKGASLLGKMGWSAGEGLGAQGTGVTAPIATDMYAQGVGLGAVGGKIGSAEEEAQRNTKGGYAEFAERTRDKAKERYEKMG